MKRLTCALLAVCILLLGAAGCSGRESGEQEGINFSANRFPPFSLSSPISSAIPQKHNQPKQQYRRQRCAIGQKPGALLFTLFSAPRHFFQRPGLVSQTAPVFLKKNLTGCAAMEMLQKFRFLLCRKLLFKICKKTFLRLFANHACISLPCRVLSAVTFRRCAALFTAFSHAIQSYSAQHIKIV